MNSADVIVIGGGFAGVIAARDLSNAGHSVILLEGRDRLGGRTWSRRFEGYSQQLEMGGTWIAPTKQKFVAAELSRYGIGTHQSPAAEDFGWAIDDEIKREPFPIPATQWPDFEVAISRINADAARIRFYEEPLGQDGLDDLDIPFSTYVEDLKAPRITSEFLLAWPTFYFGAYPQNLSALHVLSWVAGFGSASGWYTLLTDKVLGGTKNLVDHIIADSQTDVRLDNPVQSIHAVGERTQVTTRYGDVFESRAVVMATPINTWDNIDVQPPLDGSHAAMAQEKQAGESVKIWALVRGLERNFFGVGWHTRIKWMATEYTTDEGSYLVGFASAAADLNPHDKDDITRAVHEFLPNVEVIAVDSHDWNRDEFSEGTWMAYRPGQVMAHSHGLQESHGRIAFANSDIASGWAGWIDGAIESGIQAAETVKKWLIS